MTGAKTIDTNLNQFPENDGKVTSGGLTTNVYQKT